MPLCRYIVLNPVAAHLVDKAGDWPWSSYRATAGLVASPDFLQIDWLLAQFAEQRGMAQQCYCPFIADATGQPSPWRDLRGGVLLGTEEFVQRLSPRLAEAALQPEIPRGERLLHRPPLAALFAGRKGKPERARAAREAHGDWGYTLKEVGAFLNLHYSTVSRMVSGGKICD